MHSMPELSFDVIAETTPEPVAFFDHDEQTLEPVHEEINSEAPRRSKRQRTAKSFGDDFTIYLIDDTPKTISEAFASPDADDWKEAIHSEMDYILMRQHLNPLHFLIMMNKHLSQFIRRLIVKLLGGARDK